MSILSNYTPNCLVKSSVDCKIEDLEKNNELRNKKFVENFINAIKILKWIFSERYSQQRNYE